MYPPSGVCPAPSLLRMPSSFGAPHQVPERCTDLLHCRTRFLSGALTLFIAIQPLLRCPLGLAGHRTRETTDSVGNRLYRLPPHAFLRARAALRLKMGDWQRKKWLPVSAMGRLCHGRTPSFGGAPAAPSRSGPHRPYKELGATRTRSRLTEACSRRSPTRWPTGRPP